MEQEWNDFKIEYEDKDIPRPSHWTGIYIKPTRVEFWCHNGDYLTRLHDRIVFHLKNNEWNIERLYP